MGKRGRPPKNKKSTPPSKDVNKNLLPKPQEKSTNESNTDGNLDPPAQESPHSSPSLSHSDSGGSTASISAKATKRGASSQTDLSTAAATAKVAKQVRMASSEADAPDGNSSSTRDSYLDPEEWTELPYKKGRSLWWSHFKLIKSKKTGEEFRKCKYCPTKYSHIGGTGNLSTHMESCHRDKLSPATLQLLLGSTSGKTPSFLALKSPIPKDFNQHRTMRFLTNWISYNNHAFTTPTEPYFRAYSNSLNGEFKFPSAKGVRSRIVNSYFGDKETIADTISGEGHGKISCQTDLWTSDNKKAMMSVSGSWMTDEYEMCEAVLGFREIQGAHSGENIAKVFLEIVTEYRIENKLQCITTDNASSNTTFISEFAELTKNQESPFKETSHINCFAHVINLAVKDALVSIKPIIEKLRSICAAIRDSPQRLQRFHAGMMSTDEMADLFDDEGLVGEEGEDRFINGAFRPLNPVLDVATRWSSTYTMLIRAIRIRRGLDAVSIREDLHYEITDAEWKDCQDVADFLHPFAVVTKHVEGIKYPTLSCVIPLYNRLMDTLDDVIANNKKSRLLREAAKAAVTKIEKYYDKTTGDHLVATILDPRLKLHYFTANGWDAGSGKFAGINLLERNVKPALYEAWSRYMSLPLPPKEKSSSISKSSSDSTANKLDPFIEAIYVQRLITDDELEQYLLEKPEPACQSPSVYWNSKRHTWPRLARMARDYLPATATSASSERSFSTGKDLLGITRFRLEPDTMEACVCHRSWLRCDGLATTLGRHAPDECQGDLEETDIYSDDDDGCEGSAHDEVMLSDD